MIVAPPASGRLVIGRLALWGKARFTPCSRSWALPIFKKLCKKTAWRKKISLELTGFFEEIFREAGSGGSTFFVFIEHFNWQYSTPFAPPFWVVAVNYSARFVILNNSEEPFLRCTSWNKKTVMYVGNAWLQSVRNTIHAARLPWHARPRFLYFPGKKDVLIKILKRGCIKSAEPVNPASGCIQTPLS